MIYFIYIVIVKARLLFGMSLGQAIKNGIDPP